MVCYRKGGIDHLQYLEVLWMVIIIVCLQISKLFHSARAFICRFGLLRGQCSRIVSVFFGCLLIVKCRLASASATSCLQLVCVHGIEILNLLALNNMATVHRWMPRVFCFHNRFGKKWQMRDHDNFCRKTWPKYRCGEKFLICCTEATLGSLHWTCMQSKVHHGFQMLLSFFSLCL